MRHRSPHLRGGVARELGVGVERDYIAYLEQARQIADHGVEPVSTAQQQLVQIVQLAAFALIAHPLTLLRIPAARAMQKIKRSATIRTIALLQLPDALRA